ncbi:MAG: efflux RND transporter periplasmic adaptor subunit [Bacteriovoracaceae bacterium]|nr:efflux RND transporter periplasmic adaptor subunit [Bacteriovoracaceae bacterium]
MSRKHMLIAILVLFTIVSCGEGNHQSGHDDSTDIKSVKDEFFYTCSMHPSIKEHAPGKCPICHMNLTKVIVEEEVDDSPPEKITWQCEKFPDVKSESEGPCPIDGTPMIKVMENKLLVGGDVVAKVRLRKAHLEHFRPEFFTVTKMKMTKDILLLGSTVQAEQLESKIPARVKGRVEKVYIQSKGSYIRVGDPVVELYSPDLIAGGEEYIVARKSFEKTKSLEFKKLYLQAIQKLELWGIKSSQYVNWYRKGSVPNSITIYAESSGIVQKKNAVVGKYFSTGQPFFELIDLSSLWVEIDVYEHESSLISMGQKVELRFSSLPGEMFTGSIDFINPVLDPKSRTLKVRTTIGNQSGKLRPGMVADTTLHLELGRDVLVIPRNAVVDTGKRKVVWMKQSKRGFRASIIRTGFESAGHVEIVDGLKEGDRVVLEGNFLLDAQAQLFGGYEK